MRLNKSTILLVSLITTPVVFANSNIDFSDSSQHYTGFNLGYGSNDFDVGVQYAKPINADWSFMGSYGGSNNFDTHELGIDLKHNNQLGFSFEYLYDTAYDSTDLRANDFAFSAYKVKEMNKHVTFTPKLSVGNFKHQQMSSSVYYTTAELDMTYKVNNNIWLGVTPEYTYSFSHINEKNGDRSKWRDWDYSAEVGYQIDNSSAFVYSYHYDDGDNLSLFSFKHTF
ncbi:hypothetical protein [Vibrio alfacsensis]|uniref:hypothetical protein n=1 Tax=Vibrio alfacsensis TaxID=1074311 RepID=UPI001BEF0154|nr:hypothetical protein [Vibrio alfacsensis]BCN26044.1 hypothetical protein VYA_32360 [Vibrio alfacsensis]